MRDAHAMISAPSQLRMQAVLINLEEYEAGVDAMSALATPRSNLQAPLDALEQALPAIRSLTLQAARLDTDRSSLGRSGPGLGDDPARHPDARANH
jgi:hypothetical protein